MLTQTTQGGEITKIFIGEIHKIPILAKVAKLLAYHSHKKIQWDQVLMDIKPKGKQMVHKAIIRIITQICINPHRNRI